MMANSHPYNSSYYYNSMFRYAVDGRIASYSALPRLLSYTQGDIVTTSKIAHESGTNTVMVAFYLDDTDDYCCTQDPYIAVREVMLFISLCSPNCLKCNSSSYCVDCGTTSFTLNPFDHTCATTCPETLFNTSLPYS